MSITAATLDDIPALAKLLTVLFTQEADFAPDPKRQAAGLRQIITQPDTGIIFVARDASGTTVGMVSLLFTVSTATGGRAAWLEDMIVAPNARGDGAGSRLLAHAIEWGRQNRLTRITLLTDTDNVGAIRFYERAGFARSAMTALRLPLAAQPAPQTTMIYLCRQPEPRRCHTSKPRSQLKKRR